MLAVVVALAPLPFGANAPVPVAMIGAMLALALCCAPLPYRNAHYWMLLAIGLLACGFGSVILLQVSDRVRPDPVWADAAGLLGTTIQGSVTLVRNEPVFALGNIACCLAALGVGLLVGTDRLRARRLVEVIAWSCVGYALLGIVNAAVDPRTVLWRDRDDYVGAVLGPFLNRNTAAVYFGCGAIIWASLAGEILAHNGWTRVALAPLSRPLLLRLTSAAVCLCAVVGSGSRAGTLLTTIWLALAAGIAIRNRIRHAGSSRKWLVGASFAGLAAVVLVGGQAGERFASVGFGDEGRLAVYRAVLPIIAGHPWLGTGLGTFAWVYPQYRSAAPGMRNVWDKAHSTPLELGVETGLPFTLAVTVATVAAFAMLLRGALHRHRDAAVPLAACACFGLVVGHSCIDFSLQVPGLAIAVMALVGVGLAQSIPSRVPRERRREPALASATGFRPNTPAGLDPAIRAEGSGRPATNRATSAGSAMAAKVWTIAS